MEQFKAIQFLLLGDAGCGKTSLLQHFIAGECPREEPLPTLVYDLRTHRFRDPEYGLLELWFTDTQGTRVTSDLQVKHLYFKRKHAIIVVFDVTDRASYDNVVNRWLPQIRAARLENSETWALCLLANKLDHQRARQVTTREATALAQMHDMEYAEISAQYGAYEEIRKPILRLVLQSLEKERYDVKMNTLQLHSVEESQGGMCCV